VSGALAGGAGKIVEHPFDTAKVRLQLGQPLPTSLREAYRGLPAPLLSGCAETSTLFTVRSSVVSALGDSSWARVVGSAAAGAAVSLFLCPMELLKCRRQAAGDNWPGWWRTVRNLGPVGLYAGYTPTLVREVPGTVVWFGSYDYCKKQLDSRRCSDWNSAWAGALAGFCYWGCVFPVDTIKTEIQASGSGGARQAARSLYRQGGAARLYRGILPTLCRACPGNATAFWAYNALLDDS